MAGRRELQLMAAEARYIAKQNPAVIRIQIDADEGCYMSNAEQAPTTPLPGPLPAKPKPKPKARLTAKRKPKPKASPAAAVAATDIAAPSDAPLPAGTPRAPKVDRAKEREAKACAHPKAKLVNLGWGIKCGSCGSVVRR